jgi:large subunit ribosomal protein L27
MRIAQLQRPMAAVAAVASSTASASGLSRPSTLRHLQDALAGLRIEAVEGRRYATVKAQGAYRLRDSSTIPKKLGAKKTGGT